MRRERVRTGRGRKGIGVRWGERGVRGEVGRERVITEGGRERGNARL